MYDYFLDMLLECARLASEPTEGDSRGWLEANIQRHEVRSRFAMWPSPIRTSVHGRRLRARGQRPEEEIRQEPQQLGDAGSQFVSDKNG